MHIKCPETSKKCKTFKSLVPSPIFEGPNVDIMKLSISSMSQTLLLHFHFYITKTFYQNFVHFIVYNTAWNKTGACRHRIFIKFVGPTSADAGRLLGLRMSMVCWHCKNCLESVSQLVLSKSVCGKFYRYVQTCWKLRATFLHKWTVDIIQCKYFAF